MRGTTKALAFAVALLAAPVAMAPGAMAQGAAAPAPGANPSSPERPAVPPMSTAPAERPANRSADTNSAPVVGTVPVAGANSFTEAQARGRIEDAGFTDVKELKKDDQGVWRGQAMRGGQAVPVGVDFQGQVVTGTAAAAAR